LGASNVTKDHSVLAVVETGESSVIALYDWQSVLQRCFRGEITAVLEELRDEIYNLIDQHQCRVLAIDLTEVDFMPSVVLGLLVGLKSRGVKVEFKESALSSFPRSPFSPANLVSRLSNCDNRRRNLGFPTGGWVSDSRPFHQSETPDVGQSAYVFPTVDRRGAVEVEVDISAGALPKTVSPILND